MGEERGQIIILVQWSWITAKEAEDRYFSVESEKGRNIHEFWSRRRTNLHSQHHRQEVRRKKKLPQERGRRDEQVEVVGRWVFSHLSSLTSFLILHPLSQLLLFSYSRKLALTPGSKWLVIGIGLLLLYHVPTSSQFHFTNFLHPRFIVPCMIYPKLFSLPKKETTSKVSRFRHQIVRHKSWLIQLTKK